MKLGTNKDILPAFIEQQVKQSLPASQQGAMNAAGSASQSTAQANQEK
jgi:hypothetical protein